MTEASTAFSQSRPVSLRLKLRVSHGLPHLPQGRLRTVNHYIMVCTIFPCRILLWISPCNLADMLQNRIRWRHAYFGKGPFIKSSIHISIHFLHPSMAPSIKALLPSSKVASCFLLSPKRKAASPSALGQGYSFTGTISTLTSTSEMILFEKQLLPQSRFPRHIRSSSHLVKHMCSYTLYTPLSPSQLSHLLTSQACFPERLPTASPAKRRPDTQRSVEKNRNQAPFPTVTPWVVDFFFALLACKPLRRTHLGEKCLRSEACRSVKHLPIPDGCLKNLHMTEGSIQCSAPESEPCQHLWVVQHWLELQSRNMSEALTLPFSAASARGKDSSSSLLLKACWRVRWFHSAFAACVVLMLASRWLHEQKCFLRFLLQLFFFHVEAFPRKLPTLLYV